MSDGIDMQTNTKGGLKKGLGRVFSGNSLFMNTFTAEKDNQTIAFASTVPGEVLPIHLEKGHVGYTVQKGAFLCAEPTVELKVAFKKKLSTGLFDGEGLFLTRQAPGE